MIRPQSSHLVIAGFLLAALACSDGTVRELTSGKAVEANRDAGDGVAEREVGAEKHDPQLFREKAHRELGCAGQFREELGMAGIMKARQLEGVLAYGCRADRVDRSLLPELDPPLVGKIGGGFLMIDLDGRSSRNRNNRRRPGRYRPRDIAEGPVRPLLRSRWQARSGRRSRSSTC